MSLKKESAIQIIEEQKEKLCAINDAIWAHPETGYHEKFAAKMYCDALAEEGFEVCTELAGIETAFSGSFGSGHPVIGILAEFDALPGLSQTANVTYKEPVVQGGAGHGCGHNLLGVGSFAAALAVKRYLQENNLPGTVTLFGCPAEEGGAGKGFMAREGVFDKLDAALSWHPGEVNSVSLESTVANYQVAYHFYGVSSHAAMSPELGRSALDAVELMNTGVQYLREHIPTDNRVHYAIVDTGGNAPGTVQPYAQVLYLMRAPNLKSAQELYERVDRIAQGAAMMTDTKVEAEFVKACSNMVLNTELLKTLQKNLELFSPPVWDAEDIAQAEKIRKTFSSTYSYYNTLVADIEDEKLRLEFEKGASAPLHQEVLPFLKEKQGFASSDVGDVSCVCPVAQLNITTMPAGTPMHSWQEVSLGKSPMAHKGLLYAGTVIAATAIDLINDPDIVHRAKEEHKKRTGGEKFVSPIPKGVKPRIV